MEEALLKAVRSLEIGAVGLDDVTFDNLSDEALMQALMPARDDRLFMIAELLRRGISLEAIHDKTLIDEFFLDKVLQIIEIEQELAEHVEDVD
ncbi:carbamoyl phosphate synthase large subunit [Lactobacillus ginsenosidimutans] [Dolosigranulum pigrum]|nr:carbamoyl phosphate synthase large subunit [Lactobacillus ginsenosidimutans] [Dolosigranulum pigrum]